MSILILLAILAVVIYIANQHFFSYWTRRGIAQKEPTFLIGSIGGILTRKKSFGEFFQDVYNNFKGHKVLGLYFLYSPTLMINDPELINNVLIKDFQSFHDRSLTADEKLDPLTQHIFVLTGQRWRDLRVKLSPVFTSGKLKGMFPTIRDCAKVLQDYLVKNVNSGNDAFHVHDLFARFTTNVISSVAFGIDNDCINNPDNIFRQMGMQIFKLDFKRAVRTVFGLFLPNYVNLLKIKAIPQEVEDFFMTVVRQNVDYREKNNDRKDFMQLLVQLKNQGYVSVDNSDENEIESSETSTNKLTFNEVAAQAFLFFAAGKKLLGFIEKTHDRRADQNLPVVLCYATRKVG